MKQLTIPAAMFIESAAEAIPKLEPWIRADQQTELTSFGDARARQLGASGLSDDFRKGYELGLQVGRVQQVALGLGEPKP